MKMISFTPAAATALALACVLASCAGSQEPLPVLRMGETVNGRITESDPPRFQGGRIRIYQLEAREGVLYAATLRSDAFDGYLMLGQQLHGITDYPFLWAHPSRPAPGVVRLTFSPPHSGTFLIIVQSTREEGTGPFTLSLATLPVLEGPPTVARLPGGEARGAFSERDARHPDDPSRFVDHYRFDGPIGRRVRITARSALQPLGVEVGALGTAGFRTLARASTDGAINFTIPGRGDWYVRVISPPRATGEYTLTLEDRPAAAAFTSANGSPGR